MSHSQPHSLIESWKISIQKPPHRFFVQRQAGFLKNVEVWLTWNQAVAYSSFFCSTQEVALNCSVCSSAVQYQKSSQETFFYEEKYKTSPGLFSQSYKMLRLANTLVTTNCKKRGKYLLPADGKIKHSDALGGLKRRSTILSTNTNSHKNMNCIRLLTLFNHHNVINEMINY